MSKNKKRALKGSALFIVLLFFLFVRIPVTEVDAGGEIYYVWENEFTIGWIHSVEKEEWFEVYERKDDFFLLTETYFKTFGAGTPYNEKSTKTEDGFVFMEIGYEYPELNMTVSENVQTSMYMNNKTIPLFEYTDDYEVIRFRICNISLVEILRGEFL